MKIHDETNEQAKGLGQGASQFNRYCKIWPILTLMGQNLTKITICLVIQIQKVNNPGLDLDLVAVGQQHLDLDLCFL